MSYSGIKYLGFAFHIRAVTKPLRLRHDLAVAGGGGDHFAAAIDDDANVAYFGIVIIVEADKVALPELVYIAYLLPVVNLRIACCGKPSSVASRLL